MKRPILEVSIDGVDGPLVAQSGGITHRNPLLALGGTAQDHEDQEP